MKTWKVKRGLGVTTSDRCHYFNYKKGLCHNIHNLDKPCIKGSCPIKEGTNEH